MADSAGELLNTGARFTLNTARLSLVLRTREEVRAWVSGLPAEVKTQVSPVWLQLLEFSAPSDPWIHGFIIIQRDTKMVAGHCGFKGPPSAESGVELAYGIDPEFRGRGYATEAVEALAAFAMINRGLRYVRAHTLPCINASTRVLGKCGFELIGEVIDPEDGQVWRWERRALHPKPEDPRLG